MPAATTTITINRIPISCLLPVQGLLDTSALPDQECSIENRYFILYRQYGKIIQVISKYADLQG
jgi:hypothetical protein